MSKILITGGCGYVGSALVPALLALDHEIVVMDLQWFGNSLPEHDNLMVVKEDIRNQSAVSHYMKGCDAVIHLACISNDVSLELNPLLGKSINFDCFPMLVSEAKSAGVYRFIYASSSSVYGVKTEESVTEELSLEPMTDYAKYKADCEPILMEQASDLFCVTAIRPGAVCGYASRLRLDLVVNLLTAQAFFNKKITVLGGEQLRSHIHIDDMVDAYIALLQAPVSRINGKIFNVSKENISVARLAELISFGFPDKIKIETLPTEDKRSYHVCSDAIEQAIGFKAKRETIDAIDDLLREFEGKIVKEPFSSQYHNVKRMKELEIV